jgi:hypothetical protein
MHFKISNNIYIVRAFICHQLLSSVSKGLRDMTSLTSKRTFGTYTRLILVGKLSVLENHTQIETNVVKSNDTHIKQIVIACRFIRCQRFCHSHFLVSLEAENFVRFFWITV